MTPAPATDFSRFEHLTSLIPKENVSTVTREEIKHDPAPILVLTLASEAGESRPNILGPQTLINLGKAFDQVRLELAESADKYAAVVVTAEGPAFVAGADLSISRLVTTKEDGALVAELGHVAYDLLEDLPVPTIALVNGVAIGGGLELALAADYRIVSEDVKNLSLPEAFLGLVPGWGGVYRLPRLIGPKAALRVMVDDPLSNNRVLSASEAVELGIMDLQLPADDFRSAGLDWVKQELEAASLSAQRQPERTWSEQDWKDAYAAAEKTIASRTRGIPPAPAKVLEAVVFAERGDAEGSRNAQIEILSELILTTEFQNTVYSYMELLQKRAKRPAGVPTDVQPRPISKVGVVGAGLMASQLALVFAQALQVPVHMTDINEDAANRGLGFVEKQLAKQVDRGKLSTEQAAGLKDLVTAGTDQQAFSDADFVIEAIFEELELKKQVLSGLEEIISPDCILATNTSSLSVSAMAEALAHPERLIGFHFFNPVASMPLIEIVRTESTDETALATAFQLAKTLRKTPILVKDATAFVVNRVLLRFMSEIQRAFDEGTDAQTVDNALSEFGLPMTPFDLLALVGLPVAQHVTESLHASFGDRFHVSENLQRLIDANITSVWQQDDSGDKHIPAATAELLTQGDRVRSAEEIRDQVFTGLAEEIDLLLDEGVVAGPEEVDLGMILGAGWPVYRGGITPYLDQQGYSQQVRGRNFHAE
ncbi:3-hydroxyacyl-CoA dehydrogenase NAD-binding domain-containing protein [Micrococcoides hystricis]|uniref:enoyl-CoA hydratase n=1 Tax=Micrococcoides hystricis TaxID=1572761 RepID=A0ABV6P961_9MICC